MSDKLEGQGREAQASAAHLTLNVNTTSGWRVHRPRIWVSMPRAGDGDCEVGSNAARKLSRSPARAEGLGLGGWPVRPAYFRYFLLLKRAARSQNPTRRHAWPEPALQSVQTEKTKPKNLSGSAARAEALSLEGWALRR
jgi:hypothetical protein